MYEPLVKRHQWPRSSADAASGLFPFGRVAEVFISSANALAVLWYIGASVVLLCFVDTVVDSVGRCVVLVVLVPVLHEDDCQPSDAYHWHSHELVASLCPILIDCLFSLTCW